MELSERRPCPADDVFAAHLDDRLDPDDRAALEHHLDECGDCRVMFGELGRLAVSPTRQIGRFEIERLLGEGAMGAVYLARDRELDRDVALKLVRDDLELDENARERLVREARSQAQLNHANVVTVYEVGRRGDACYIAMEYVEGETLLAWLEKPRPWAEVVSTFIAAGRGLAAAHAIDLVHRDFKPANVMLGADGRVAVTDFGLARSSRATRSPRRLPRARTASGAVVGTPAYMAPEQFRAEPVTAAADQFAFCVSLYEGLYGQRPHRAESYEELETAVVGGILRATPRGPVPRWLHDIVCRGLDPDPARRFASMADLLGCIESRQPRPQHSYECPFPGLARFGDDDADRYFGREAELETALRLLEERTTLTIIGPSGAGKSSFLRAGVAAQLRGRGSWEVVTIRPGHNPATRLRRLIANLDPDASSLASALESFASARQTRLLLIVDQLEELYTLSGEAERDRAVAELAGLSGDPGSPVRLAVAIRSDLLDRVGEHRELVDRMVRGMLFLPAPDERMVREALTRPLELVGFGFESPAIADDIVKQLAGVQSALPLLQFAAQKMWERRDRERQLIPTAAYAELGQLSGVLAVHADTVISGLPRANRDLAREIICRLITPERTRDVVPLAELETLDHTGDGGVGRIIGALVDARLILINQASDDSDPVAELVHESLIESWPRLASWLDRDAETGALLAEIRVAARQWHARERPAGMLWTGDAVADARRFRDRHRGPLSTVEDDFIAAVIGTARRRVRVRRFATIASFAVLIAMVTAAAIGLVLIRGAEREAHDATNVANEQKRTAVEARAEIQRQLELLRAEKSERARAEAEASKATELADTRQTEVVRTQADLEVALRRAEEALRRVKLEEARAREALAGAERATAEERRAKAKLERLVDEKQRRIRELEKRRERVITIE